MLTACVCFVFITIGFGQLTLIFHNFYNRVLQQHGTSHVSVYDENYTRLGSWVKRQRAEYKKYQLRGRTNSQMTKERIDKLDSIGFQWRLKAEKLTWDDRFEVSVLEWLDELAFYVGDYS